MEKYNLQTDLEVFGIQVKAFPKGIGEAFQALMKMLPGGFDRAYYGISYLAKDGAMVYIAAAIEKQEGEAEKYNCDRYIIEKGEYLAVTINSWRSKTDSIKDVFNSILKGSRADKTRPAVEWYKNDTEMMCMVKINSSEN